MAQSPQLPVAAPCADQTKYLQCTLSLPSWSVAGDLSIALCLLEKPVALVDAAETSRSLEQQSLITGGKWANKQLGMGVSLHE